MKINSADRNLTFGEFIARTYDVFGERLARGIVQISIKSHLIEFRDFIACDCLKPSLLKPRYDHSHRLPRLNQTSIRTIRMMNKSPDHTAEAN